MDLHTKIENFNRRWNLKDDESLGESIIKFKNRVMNIFVNIDFILKSSSISQFCSVQGLIENDYTNSNIFVALRDEKDLIKYLRMLEIIFSLDFKGDFEMNGTMQKKILFKKMQDIFKFSNINARIEKINGEILILPAGEKQLDEEVVDQVLSFLDGSALSHFIEALKDYEKNTEKGRVNSVDHLRRSLEEQLRKELENRKGLQKNIPELGKKIKSIQVNDDVKNIIVSILNSLDKLFNENSKHKDGIISEPENEYLIYQVALLMRYVHKILMIQD